MLMGIWMIDEDKFVDTVRPIREVSRWSMDARVFHGYVRPLSLVSSSISGNVLRTSLVS